MLSSSGLFYIERYTTEPIAVLMVTVNYTHDLKGNSITNISFVNTATITKIMLYIEIRAAEDNNDREYKRLLIKTVVDTVKATKSMQTNLFLKGFLANIVEHMDFELKFPFRPVSRPLN